MSPGVALGVFVGALILSTVSSMVLSTSLERVGARLHLTEGLLGLVTALAADSPEISSAVTAMIGGNHDLGLGVVLGSNIFNIAALLGVSAIVAQRVDIDHPVLLLNGGVALLVTVLTAALLEGVLTPALTLVLILAILIPYAIISSLRSTAIDHWRLPFGLTNVLCVLVEQVHQDARKGRTPPQAVGHDALTIVPALFAIVVASYGLVQAAIVLGGAWGVPHIVLGTLVLATLTGIPNTLTGISLARHHRGAAVVSETLNSNTLNVLSGVALPALVFGLDRMTSQTLLSIWWLLGMTLLATGLTYRRGGLLRREGVLVVVAYLLFVGVVVWRG